MSQEQLQLLVERLDPIQPKEVSLKEEILIQMIVYGVLENRLYACNCSYVRKWNLVSVHISWLQCGKCTAVKYFILYNHLAQKL